jgi:sulfatase maturation enzyme AslB (radical SAM superfamily)
VPGVTFGWQGGEPTLLGVDFFARAVALQQRARRPGMRIVNTLQTNGTLSDDDWGHFLKEHDFLVGLSLDGPRALHDAYRRDGGGAPFIQFIPIVEWEDGRTSARSVSAAQDGDFLTAISDEWAPRDLGRVSVQIFDVALLAWLGQPPPLCEGYQAFFHHIDRAIRLIAAGINAGEPPERIRLRLLNDAEALERAFAHAGHNDPCPCGSGRKFKHCHGRR